MRTQRSQEGFLLITVLMLVSGLLTLSAVGMARSATDVLVTNRFVTSQQAFHVAEGGVDCVIRRLHISINASSISAVCSNPVPPLSPGIALVVAVQFNGVDRYVVTSTATQIGASVQQRLEATLQRFDPTHSPFRQAMYGTITVDNSPGVLLGWSALVDSYHSQLGAYGGVNVASNSTVQSGNPVAWNSIYIHNNSLVRGAAYTAPGGSFASNNTPPSAEDPDGNGVTGTTGTRAPLAFVSPVRPSAPTSCTDLGDLIVGDGEDVPLGEESYCANTLTVYGGGRLRFPNMLHLAVAGDVDVLSGGRLELSEGIVNVSGRTYVSGAGSVLRGTGSQVDLYTRGMIVSTQAQVHGVDNLPTNFRIYNVAPASEPVFISQQSVLYGAIYSPNASTRVQDAGSAIFGAIIGTQTTVWGAAQLHFDEALMTTGNWPQWLEAGIQINVLSQRHL